MRTEEEKEVFRRDPKKYMKALKEDIKIGREKKQKE